MRSEDVRCPTPHKVRYATVETAQQRAEIRTQLDENKVYQPYACACGWIHLTTQPGKKNIITTAKVETPEELLALTPIEFRFIVSCDVKRKLDAKTGELLRTAKVNPLWVAELKLLWVESLWEHEHARSTKHKQDILVFQKYISMRRTEATTLRQRFLQQGHSMDLPAPKYYRMPVVATSGSSIRREAFCKAVHELSTRHSEELLELYHQELRPVWPEGKQFPMVPPLKYLKYLRGPGAKEIGGEESEED